MDIPDSLAWQVTVNQVVAAALTAQVFAAGT